MQKMKKILSGITMFMLIFLLPGLLSAQNKTISGKVTDTKSNPVPGVSIVAKTGGSTITDAEGRFTLSASDNTVFTISSIGFKTQLVTLNGNNNIEIKLEEDVARLDEVVVTGLATTVKRRNLANAVATISSRELSGVAPAQTFDAALNGKIPGAYINANTGAPGGGMSVKLRGVTSVYGNTQPLYVIDGVFADNSSTSAGLNVITTAAAGGAPTSAQDNATSRIADIRSGDIENIEILKGASAAAIYGSKAAAGVIIITTKKRQSR